MKHSSVLLGFFLTSAFTCLESNDRLLGQTPRRYLAADATQRFDLQNIEVTNHQAQHVGQAFELDQTWEQDLRVNYPGATVYDAETSEYRMYYEVVIGGESATGTGIDRHLALATSSDGINWTKPELNITGNTYSDSPQNNFVSVAGTTFAQHPNVFIDVSAPADQRYKITYRDFEFNRLALLTGVSSDGINFQRVGQVDDLTDQTRGFDSQNIAFYDSNTDEYRAYSRYWYPSPDRRGVVLHRNDTWEGDWNASRELILDPAEIFDDGANTQLYTPGISAYQGQYIGLPSEYHDFFSDGRITTGLIHSVDGENWQSLGPEDFFDVSVHSPTGDDFQIYAQPSIIEKDGELLFYYSYLDQNHEAEDAVFIDLDYQSELHIAKLRRDGFTSFDSVGDETATWLTDAISLTSEASFLELNAIINGSLSAEILDAETLEVIDGFSLAESSLLSPGDYLDARLEWTGDRSLAELDGQDVRFRFNFEDSSVFSFGIGVNAVPEPSSSGLLLAIGLCLTGMRKRKL